MKVNNKIINFLKCKNERGKNAKNINIRNK